MRFASWWAPWRLSTSRASSNPLGTARRRRTNSSLSSGIDLLRRSSRELMTSECFAVDSYHKAAQTRKPSRCFFPIAAMLKAVHESFPAHKAPPVGHASVVLLSYAGCPLLANQSARAVDVDVQHRQLTAGAGTISGAAGGRAAGDDLDDSGFGDLVSLCSAGVGSVSQLSPRARRRIGSSDHCLEPVWNGSDRVAVGLW